MHACMHGRMVTMLGCMAHAHDPLLSPPRSPCDAPPPPTFRPALPSPSVYIIETDDDDQLPDEGAEDLCSLCSRGHCPENMIECSRCLGGFHMKCMKPALKAVPEVGAHAYGRGGRGGRGGRCSHFRPAPRRCNRTACMRHGGIGLPLSTGSCLESPRARHCERAAAGYNWWRPSFVHPHS